MNEFQLMGNIEAGLMGVIPAVIVIRGVYVRVPLVFLQARDNP